MLEYPYISVPLQTTTRSFKSTCSFSGYRHRVWKKEQGVPPPCEGAAPAKPGEKFAAPWPRSEGSRWGTDPRQATVVPSRQWVAAQPSAFIPAIPAPPQQLLRSSGYGSQSFYTGLIKKKKKKKVSAKGFRVSWSIQLKLSRKTSTSFRSLALGQKTRKTQLSKDRKMQIC